MPEVLKITEPCPIELECPDGVHRPGPASLALARYLFNAKGRRVLDLCCGTGLYAVAAARLGASEAWASDLDPAAADCARRNAVRNGVKVEVRQGDLFEAVTGPFDLIATNPPQTPAPAALEGPKFAGEDGLRFFEPLLRAAPDRLPEGGVLLTFLISLADRRRFESMLSERFRFRTLPRLKRPFSREEFDGYAPGLFDFQEDRRRRGLAEFSEEDGRPFFWVDFYMAMRK